MYIRNVDSQQINTPTTDQPFGVGFKIRGAIKAADRQGEQPSQRLDGVVNEEVAEQVKGRLLNRAG